MAKVILLWIKITTTLEKLLVTKRKKKFKAMGLGDHIILQNNLVTWGRDTRGRTVLVIHLTDIWIFTMLQFTVRGTGGTTGNKTSKNSHPHEVCLPVRQTEDSSAAIRSLAQYWYCFYCFDCFPAIFLTEELSTKSFLRLVARFIISCHDLARSGKDCMPVSLESK